MKKKEVVFNKEHPKGLVREVDDEKQPPHPHEQVVEKQEPSNEVILTSPNGTRFKLTVSDTGKLKATKVEQDEKEHKTE